MERIKLQVSGSQIQVVQRPAAITAGTVGLEAEFVFDSHWDGLGKTVVFRAGETVITAALEQDTHTVPWEVMEKPDLWLIVGVYGANAKGTVVIPTLWTKVAAIYTGTDPEGDPALEPSNPVWQETLSRVATMEPLVEEHIYSTDNPHGITCDQIGAVTQKEFRDIVSNLDGSADPEQLIPHLLNQDNPHGVTAAQAGAAPEGYGLGTMVGNYAIAEDANTAIHCGWYRVHSSTANGVGYVGLMRVDGYSAKNVVQTIFPFQRTDYSAVRRRFCLNGTWDADWAWENPPMYNGVEYRTTKLCDGKFVYTKQVNLGGVSAGGSKDITHGIADIATPISVKILDADGTLSGAATALRFTPTNIAFTLPSNVGGKVVYAIFEYTKG